MMKYFAKWILLGAAMHCISALAATTTTALPVAATVINICDTLTATSLSFGNYDPTSHSPTDSTNSISVRCTLNDAYTITLNSGTTSGGSVSQRLMTNGTRTLNYNLYTTSARTTIWGDGVTGGSVSTSGTGFLQTYTVYGRIPSNQVVPAGAFSDTITVSVNY